jgi:Domain of unknown function (DUF1707)
MPDDRWIRASDQDRENAAELLSEAYAAGRLSREELDERAAAAYSATTWGELRDLTADLPLAPPRSGLPSAAAASPRAPRRTYRGLHHQLRWIYALMLTASVGGMVAPLAPWATMVLMAIALLLAAMIGTQPGGTRAETRTGHGSAELADLSAGRGQAAGPLVRVTVVACDWPSWSTQVIEILSPG